MKQKQDYKFEVYIIISLILILISLLFIEYYSNKYEEIYYELNRLKMDYYELEESLESCQNKIFYLSNKEWIEQKMSETPRFSNKGYHEIADELIDLWRREWIEESMRETNNLGFYFTTDTNISDEKGGND